MYITFLNYVITLHHHSYKLPANNHIAELTRLWSTISHQVVTRSKFGWINYCRLWWNESLLGNSTKRAHYVTLWLLEPGGSMPYSQVLSNNPYLSRINSIPCIDTYFFKIHSNIVLPSTPRPSSRSLSCRLTCTHFQSTPTFFNTGYIFCLP